MSMQGWENEWVKVITIGVMAMRVKVGVLLVAGKCYTGGRMMY